MQRSNTAADELVADDDLGGDSILLGRVVAGALGYTVRCTPRRRTVVATASDGRVLFVKLRRGRLRDAKAEWRWLHLLPMLGVRTARPVALARLPRGQSALCTLAATGRPCDALLAEALLQGRRGLALAFACRVVAPLVRGLHDRGIAVRDLYWNHLFAADLAADEVVLLDVERVFRPRLRRRRWVVKDLAGLLASVPGDLPALRDRLAFLRAYLGGGGMARRERRRLGRDVLRKAERIRAHAPRYG